MHAGKIWYTSLMNFKWKTLLLIFLLGMGGFLYAQWDNASLTYSRPTEEVAAAPVVPGAPSKGVGMTLPMSKTIPNLLHVGQSFNNCSSVGLLIALSRWGITETQERIADGTRPWNNPTGNNDDKSVTLYELAHYAENNHGMITYVRPNGNIELLKKFVANDIPVLTRALMYKDDDIVHYRVIRGYDESKKILIESDGIEGAFKKYTYEKWMHMWKDFNYSYAIIVPEEKRKIVEAILAEEKDEIVAWKNAKTRAESEIAKNPNNLWASYNLITALYYTGDYEGTVREFEKIEDNLTRRKLWYQIEPIEAYFKLGKYDRVVQLVDEQANDNNKSISELYVLKGKIYELRGDKVKAEAEYEKAIYYNKSLQSAKDALVTLKV